MSRKKRYIVGALLVLVLVMLLPVRAEAASPLSDFSYTADPTAGTVLLERYTGSTAAVVVPGTYRVGDVSCRVILDSQNVFRDHTAITAVTLLPGVTFLNGSMKRLFSGCSALSNVDLNRVDTGGVTDMSYLFYKCTALQKLDLSGLNTASVKSMRSCFSNCSQLSALTGYETWDTGALEDMYQMFNRVEKLQTIDLSRWDLDQVKNTGWCFQMCKARKILLPDALGVISAGFLNHAASVTGSSFTVPAGVNRIGYAHTFYDFATNAFTEFRVAPGNTHYTAVDGILYSADGTEMLAVPRGKKFENNTFEIPEGVTFLGELSFSRNNQIRTLILPDSYTLQTVEQNDPRYIVFEDTGNLNAGLNLNIAIYCYTSIAAYEVKPTNPQYRSADGILYSKDGTALMAVPTRYAKQIVIPEGTAVWQSGAMWNAGDAVDALMSQCTGVTIPASMTQIAPDQLEKLNRLENRYSRFQITLDPANPAFYLGENGNLIARERLEQAQITLEQTLYTYDGTPKTPAVTVLAGEKVLIPGTDYTLMYENNTDAGTAAVRITGMGNWFGTAQVEFSVRKAVPAYTVPEDLTAVYTQKLAQIPLPVGFAWTDGSLSVGDAGENRFTLTFDPADANYEAVTDIQVRLTVLPKAVTADLSAVAECYPFTGKPITPPVAVTDQGRSIPRTEYGVFYTDNTLFGTARILVKDLPGGNYTVSGSGSFRIVPGWKLILGGCLGVAALSGGVALCVLHRRRKKKSEKMQTVRSH